MEKEHSIRSDSQSSFLFMKDIVAAGQSYRVGVIGASGAVGQTLIRILKERAFPVGELHLFASSRSEGRWMETPFGQAPLMPLDTRRVPALDFAFLAAGSDVARRWGWRLARRGAVVIDKSSYFRDKPYASLVVPEVNPQALSSEHPIIANPNCTTIPVVMALAPIHRNFGLKSFTAVSFQSVSGHGKEGLLALERELNDPDLNPTAFPQRIAHNVIPWIGDGDGRSSSEELKMISETRRILALPRLPVQVTSVRVPTRVGHAIAVHATFREPVDEAKARQALTEFPGIELYDNPQRDEYPTPLMVTGRDEVFVGRLRRSRGWHSLAFWVVTDNLRKGAATNAVQIAEVIIADRQQG